MTKAGPHPQPNSHDFLWTLIANRKVLNLLCCITMIRANAYANLMGFPRLFYVVRVT